MRFLPYVGLYILFTGIPSGGNSPLAATGPWGEAVIPCSVQQRPATLNEEHKADILAYLARLVDNRQLIVGQHCGYGPDQTNDYYQAYVDRLASETNKYVGLVGADLGFYPCTGYPVSTLIDHWNQGGLVTLSWHADNPFEGGFTVYCNSVESREEVDLSSLLKDAAEGPAKSAYRTSLDKVAGALQKLRDAGVIVLWRPFHEMNGNSFWWGIDALDSKQTNTLEFRALWRDMYETMTYEYGLDNLIWIYAVMPDLAWNASVTAYYPGSDYVDLVGIDYYGEQPRFPDYDSLKTLGKTLVMSETGPSDTRYGDWDELALMTSLCGKAAYFLQWHSWPGAKVAIRDNLNANAMMNSDKVITRDEIAIEPDY